jgi:uncharacterized protein involved in exopolysaccharide biosynthesis
MNELQNSKNESDAISLLDIVEIFAIHIKVIIIIPFVISIIAIIYALYFTSPVFTSTAKIMSSSTGSFSQSLGIGAQFGIDFPNALQSREWVYPEIIKSRTLAKSLLKRNFDTQRFGFQQPLLKIITNNNNNSNSKYLETIAINSLTGLINVYKERNANFYTLEVTVFEAKFAADLARAVIEELDNHQREYNNAKVLETRKFIEERIFEVGKELNSAEEALKNFRVRNRRMDNSPNLLLDQQRLSREVAVLTGVFTTLKQQLENAKIDEVKESDYVIVLDQPEVPIIRSAPNRKQMVVLSGFAGISIAVALVFLLELLNRNTERKEKLNKIKSLAIRNILELFFLKK